MTYETHLLAGAVELGAEDDLADELAQMQFEGHGEGHKSSEGDGRTAADIEAENARKVAEDSE